MGLAHRLTRDLFRAYDAAKRDREYVEKFNARWHRLNVIADILTTTFVVPLGESDKLSVSEKQKLDEYVLDMNDWRQAIGSQINDAQQRHLSRYATSIKKVTLKAAKLCQKHSICVVVESVRYNAATNAILLNEQPIFYLGN